MVLAAGPGSRPRSRASVREPIQEDPIKALFLSCTLKRSPDPSNTESLAKVLVDAFEAEDVETEMIRLVDLNIAPGVTSDEGDGDEWPRVHEAILGADIVVMVTPTWVGRPPASPSARSSGWTR